MSDTKFRPITSPAAFIGVSGEGFISFGSGQPDLAPPKGIFEDIGQQRLFRYGPIQGNLDLREALAKEYLNADPENFVITNGASEALDLFFRALYQHYRSVDVLVCQPYYYSYPPIITFAGHTPVYTKLKNGRIDLDDFKEKIKTVTAIVINTPSNPTGRVEDVSTLKEIERLAAQQGIYIVSDEVYKDLIYEGEHYTPSGAGVVTINSFSKTYSMCGLRIGYLHTSDPVILRTIIEMKTHTSMNTSVLSQDMALRALQAPREFIDQQRMIWQERRDFVYKRLNSMGLDLWKPEGAFYVLPRVENPAQAVNDLFRDYKVIVYDGDWFGAPGRIRLSYALDIAKIEEGLGRIDAYLSKRQATPQLQRHRVLHTT